MRSLLFILGFCLIGLVNTPPDLFHGYSGTSAKGALPHLLYAPFVWLPEEMRRWVVTTAGVALVVAAIVVRPQKSRKESNEG
jgi:hypothetical protein